MHPAAIKNVISTKVCVNMIVYTIILTQTLVEITFLIAAGCIQCIF